MGLDGIIFDVDGVIVETENLHRMAYNAMFKKKGIPVTWTPADYKAILNQPAGRKLQSVVDSMGVENKEETRLILHREKHLCFEEILDNLGPAGRLVPRPGVLDLIDEALSRKIKLGLATVSPRPSATKLLTYALGADLFKSFVGFCTGYEVENTKPAPDVYLAVLSQICTLSDNTVAIEDTEYGAEASRNAGLKTVVTPSEYTLGGVFSGADLVVPDLAHYKGNERVTVEVLEGLL